MLRVWDFRICFETAVVNRVLFSVATCCYRKRTSLNCSTLNGFCFRCKSIFHIWIQLMIYFFNEVHWIPLDENNIVTIPIRTLQFNMPKSYAIFKHSSVHLFRQFQVFVLPALENLNFPIKKKSKWYKRQVFKRIAFRDTSMKNSCQQLRATPLDSINQRQKPAPWMNTQHVKTWIVVRFCDLVCYSKIEIAESSLDAPPPPPHNPK